MGTNGKTTTADRARIVEVRVRNVKCVREAVIDMSSGDIHEVRGDSGQGKTSILRSIEAALLRSEVVTKTLPLASG
mgnify:CR=1 FL=1